MQINFCWNLISNLSYFRSSFFQSGSFNETRWNRSRVWRDKRSDIWFACPICQRYWQSFCHMQSKLKFSFYSIIYFYLIILFFCQGHARVHCKSFANSIYARSSSNAWKRRCNSKRYWHRNETWCWISNGTFWINGYLNNHKQFNSFKESTLT